MGYEINFNRYFYRFNPPRSLEEIEADIGHSGAEIVEMLREVARIPRAPIPDPPGPRLAVGGGGLGAGHGSGRVLRQQHP